MKAFHDLNYNIKVLLKDRRFVWILEVLGF